MIMILGISGTNSSGKDTIAHYLESKGFFHVSLSDILRQEMKKKNIEINRDNMINFGNKLEIERGTGALAKIAIEEFQNKDNLVISSVRKPSEIDFLHTIPGFRLIFVDVPIKTRYDRMLLRAREGENTLSFEGFKNLQEKEMNGANSQNLSYCKEKADIQIDNSNTPESLFKKIDTIIQVEK